MQTQFRIWATKTLKEFIIKDFVKTIRVGMAKALLPYLAKGKMKAFEYAFAICKSSLRKV